jgi:hypothetical protein
MPTTRYAHNTLCPQHVMPTSRYAHITLCSQHVMPTTRYAHTASPRLTAHASLRPRQVRAARWAARSGPSSPWWWWATSTATAWAACPGGRDAAQGGAGPPQRPVRRRQGWRTHGPHCPGAGTGGCAAAGGHGAIAHRRPQRLQPSDGPRARKSARARPLCRRARGRSGPRAAPFSAALVDATTTAARKRPRSRGGPAPAPPHTPSPPPPPPCAPYWSPFGASAAHPADAPLSAWPRAAP